jgi:AraC-like DNA-binding protein
MEARQLRVDRHTSDRGGWEMAHAAPSRALRAHLRHYCGYAERSAAPFRRREVPSPEVTLIVSLGPSIEVRDAADPSSEPQRLGSFVASLHDSASFTEYEGEQHGIEVNLTPLGAYSLFGLPMHELTNEVVRLDEVWGRQGALLAERLYHAPGWRERFDILDTHFGARLAEGPEPSLEVAWALGALRRTDGRAAIRGIVDELGWSHRRLIGEFREQVGMAPKTLARLLRFDRVIQRLHAEGGGALAEIALDCGYYDQPHLNRDFRQFAATTPGEFVASLLPDGGGVAA